MEDFKKTIKSIEESHLIKKCVSETNENEEKEKKRDRFLYIILTTLNASLLAHLLANNGKSILKYKNIIRMSPKFTVFTEEIICLLWQLVQQG